MMFCFPFFLWKFWENNKLESILKGCPIAVMDEEKRSQKIKNLSHFFKKSLNQHNQYAIKYFVCELLNAINISINAWILNSFLNGMFVDLGSTPFDNTILFPTNTKCSFYMYGPSGTVERQDGHCILPLNPINSKIFKSLWWWFTFLSAITDFGLIIRLIIFLVPSLRMSKLNIKESIKSKFPSGKLTRNLNFGDYFLLYRLRVNMDYVNFDCLMEEMVSDEDSEREKLYPNL